MNKEYIKKKQNILFTFFENAKTKNKIPHLILLHSDPKANLLDIAFYLAKSINCKQDSFACNKCSRCEKFDKQIHPDFHFIDGSDHTIKKEEVDELQNHFSLGAIENDTTVVYIINEIQNITSEASNALLKFFEEPKVNVVAILTTTNITKVLPTIVSRSSLVNIKVDVDIYSDIYKITQNTAVSTVISNITGNKQQILQLANSTEFLTMVEVCLHFMSCLQANEKQATFILLNEAVTNFKQQAKALLFYKVLSIILIDSINKQNSNPFNLNKELLFEKKDKIISIINLLNQAIYKQQANLNMIGIIGQINYILLK